jgi:hypothetical protein
MVTNGARVSRVARSGQAGSPVRPVFGAVEHDNLDRRIRLGHVHELAQRRALFA